MAGAKGLERSHRVMVGKVLNLFCFVLGARAVYVDDKLSPVPLFVSSKLLQNTWELRKLFHAKCIGEHSYAPPLQSLPSGLTEPRR